MATIKDVAQKAEVSTATVSRVLNNSDYVSPELKSRVHEAIDELGYRQDQIAKGLKTQRTYTIGVIVSAVENPFFASVVKGIEDEAAESEHSLIICDTEKTWRKEVDYIDELIQKKVDGIIFAPTGETESNAKHLIQNDIPFVFIDRKIESIQADAVLSDNVSGAKEAVSYLIDQGHRRIGIILGLKTILTSGERYKGYKQALEEYGIELQEELVVRGNYRGSGGYEATNELLSLSDPPTAILTTNNRTTVGAIKAIKQSGLRWPQEISIVGFDDLEWLDIFDIPLTTVAQQPRQMGERAAQLLLKRINEQNFGEESEEIRLNVELKVRQPFESTMSRDSDLKKPQTRKE